MRNFLQKFGWISALIALVIIVIVVIFSNTNYFSLNSPEKKDSSLEKEESEEKIDTEIISSTEDNYAQDTSVDADNVSDPDLPDEKIEEIEGEENERDKSSVITNNQSEKLPSISDSAELDEKADLDIGKVLNEKKFEEGKQELTSNNKKYKIVPEEEKSLLKHDSGLDLKESSNEKKESNEKSFKNIEIEDQGKNKKNNEALPLNKSDNLVDATVSNEASNKALQVDVMRVDETGEAIVAGKTQPNSEVEIMANDKVIASTESDDSGNFVAMGSIEQKSEATTLTVRSKNAPVEAEQKNTELEDEVASKKKDLLEKSDSSWNFSDDIFVVLPLKIQRSGTKTLEEPTATPLIVQSDSNDIKIIQYKDISSVEQITIDSISYSDLGEAILIGRAKPYYKILIYLDNQLSGTSEVGASGGWTTELTGLLPGIYRLRLDEVDSSGVVQSRIETPFKKESQDVLTNMISGSITVQPGNSLWRIARRIFGRGIRYIEIYEKNSNLIKDPDLIYPGQVFSIPTENFKQLLSR